MGTYQLDATPERIMDPFEDVPILFQNQGHTTILLAFDEEMLEPLFIEPWESVTVLGTGSPVWACAPMVRNGYRITLFWGPVLKETG